MTWDEWRKDKAENWNLGLREPVAALVDAACCKTVGGARGLQEMRRGPGSRLPTPESASGRRAVQRLSRSSRIV